MSENLFHEWPAWARVSRDQGHSATKYARVALRHPLGKVAVRWTLGIGVIAVVIGLGDAIVDAILQRLGLQQRPLIAPDSESVQTVVQVVPAIVVAIFVFAVGTQFVVAQVVPTARGTRAVEVLRERHLAWTLAPALALTPLSALVLVLDQGIAWPLASALLVGAVAYLLISTGFLLSILGEATDPDKFAALLLKLQRDALRRLESVAEKDEPTRQEPLEGQPSGPVVDPIRRRLKKQEHQRKQSERPGSPQGGNHQAEIGRAEELKQQAKHANARVPETYRTNGETHRAAVTDICQGSIDDLYKVLRTLRGWARSSATAGDSRELQVALEGTLKLVDEYAKSVAARCGVPTDYNRSALEWKWSPLRQEASSGRDYLPAHEPWVYWVPPPCPRDPDAKVINQSIMTTKGEPPPDEPPREHAEVVRRALARIWVANEVGRSIVRAVEFATTTKTLLDRDRARLLLSLVKAARRFKEHQDYVSAGVMVAYLVELGLGARRCPPDEVDWHFEPLARLAGLNQECANEPASSDVQAFAMGTAAAVIKVAEAIAEARVSEHHGKQSGRAWNGSVDVCDHSVITIVERTVGDLRTVPEVGRSFTLKAAEHTQPQPASEADAERPRSALDLAATPLLEPRGQAAIRPTDSKLLGLVQAVLLVNSEQWHRGKRDEWISQMRKKETDQKREEQKGAINGWA